ncbi:MAG: hypothetical protein AAGF83_20755 [Cyanobacteria bacterium P01_G01_bin.67]
MNLKEVIVEAIETLNHDGNFELTLNLIAESINNNLIEINDVIEILQELALDNDEHIDRALEILTNNCVEIPIQVKHRQFTIKIKYRLGEIVRFVHNEDLTKIAESRVQGIIYDLKEYLNDISNQ